MGVCVKQEWLLWQEPKHRPEPSVLPREGRPPGASRTAAPDPSRVREAARDLQAGLARPFATMCIVTHPDADTIELTSRGFDALQRQNYEAM
jgi:hypothetical protein